MNKLETTIRIKKNDSVIASPRYYELWHWNYINGRPTLKSDKEKYRFRKDETIGEGDTLIFLAENISEKIERDHINFHLNFSAIKDGLEEMLNVTDDDAKQNECKIKLFEKIIEVKVELFSLEKGKSGDIIRIKFLKIDPSIKIKIIGKENHSTEYIDKYIYSHDLVLWK